MATLTREFGMPITKDELQDNYKYSKLARAFMLLIKNQYTPEHINILGRVLLGLKLYILPKESEHVAFVAQQRGSVQLTLHVNLEHKITKEASSEELAYILLHEIMHVVSKHTSERYMKGKDPMLWNLATDHVINTLIDIESREHKALKTPKSVFKINDPAWTEDRTLESYEEEVYRWLLKQQEKNPKKVQEMIEQFEKSGMKDLEEGDNSEDSEIVPVSDDAAETIRATVKKLREEAQKRKGSGTVKFEEWLDNVLIERIPWEDILKNSLNTASVHSEELTWSKPNLMLRHIGIRPGIIEEEKPSKLVIVIDQSGSMSQEELQVAAGVIATAIEHYKKIHIIHHSHEILWEKEFDVETEVDELEKNMTRVSGTGGTSHLPVFELINNMISGEEEVSSQPSSLIFFTDMYSDIEKAMSKYPEVMNIPNWWLGVEGNINDSIVDNLITKGSTVIPITRR